MELIAVVAILGLLASAGMMRFGHATLNTTDTEGFVRRLMLDMRQARRAAIATGDDHFIQLNRDAGVVTGYDLFRDEAGGAVAVQPTESVPDDTVVTTSVDTWTFDFDGFLATGGATTLTVGGTSYTWTVVGYVATGAVRSSRVLNP